jgi:peptidoglycan/LPS O-acetylase OafA/YrhL
LEKGSNRIAPVDGLRALAVLGVIWAHVWSFCGNPSLVVGRFRGVPLDLQRVVSLIGTGVDLFFVISGFCMYFMYIRRQTTLDWGNYAVFIKRRWLRLSPGFYMAALVCAAGLWLSGRPFPSKDLFAHGTFTHTIFPGTGQLAAPLWSLATEWHFYLLLPFLIWASVRWGFGRVLVVLMIASVGFRLWMYQHAESAVALWKSQLPPRLIEFCWGIWIARWVVQERPLPRVLQGRQGFLVGLLVAYAGRLLMTTEIIRWAGRAGVLSQVMAEPVLTLGYGLMLWNVVVSPSSFANALSWPASQAIGRWSYSLYLWHWWPCWFISRTLTHHLGSSLSTQYLAFFLLLAVLLPVGWLSYKWLEAPYFRKSQTGSST